MKQPLARCLSEWQRLQSPGGRCELGAFSLEGTRLLERAVAAGTALRTVLVSQTYALSEQPREKALVAQLQGQADLDFHVLPDPQLASLVAGRSFGAIVGMAQMPTPADLSELMAANLGAFRPGVLVVVDATDPGNVGALVRTALASGARAFFAVGSTDPFHPKAVRTSMGSLFRLPVATFKDADELFRQTAPLGFVFCGAVARNGARLDAFAPKEHRPLALVLGSEAFGLDAKILARLDQQLTIPMPDNVDSLSINAAASVCLYELLARARRED